MQADMSKDHSEGFRGLVRSLVGAVVLLAIVLLVPPAFSAHGISFWAEARQSLWTTLGDWPAAWCSLKIILVGAATFLLIQALDELLMVIRRDYMSANIFFTLMVVPSLIFLFGAFYLAKALL